VRKTALKGLSINKVTVYEFLFRDPKNGEFVLAPWKATREAIELLHGRIIEVTAESVAKSRLDENGIMSETQVHRPSGATPQSHP